MEKLNNLHRLITDKTERKCKKNCQKCSEWNDLSPRRRQNILNQVRNGQMSQSAAARLLAVGQATISRKLRDNNLNPIGQPRKGTVLMTRGNSLLLQSSQKTLLSWLAHPLAPAKSNVEQSAWKCLLVGEHHQLPGFFRHSSRSLLD